MPIVPMQLARTFFASGKERSVVYNGSQVAMWPAVLRPSYVDRRQVMLSLAPGGRSGQDSRRNDGHRRSAAPDWNAFAANTNQLRPASVRNCTGISPRSTPGVMRILTTVLDSPWTPCF